MAEIDKLKHTDWYRLKGNRATAMEDALVSALDLLQTPQVGDVICLVTDGGENASQSSKSRVEALLESAGARVYAMLPASALHSGTVSTPEVQGPSELRDLTSATGGALLLFVPGQVRNLPSLVPVPTWPTVVTDNDREELKQGAQAFQDEILSFTTLRVRLPLRPMSVERRPMTQYVPFDQSRV